MAHATLGRKHRCASCGIKFYDLKKSPAVCPACGTKFDPEVLLKSRRGRGAAKVDEVKAQPKEEEVSEDELVEKADDEFENDDDVLSSESELLSIAADGDDESEPSGSELIDVLDDDLDADDDSGSDNDENM